MRAAPSPARSPTARACSRAPTAARCFSTRSRTGPAPQVKLLRVLQTREFKPVGTSRFVRFDARVIAASNQDVERLVQHRRFRADLFFRLDVLRIRVPALRERREDVPLLFEHSIARFNRANGTRFGAISPQSMAALVRRPWPGNVRELENVIERTLVNSSHPTIDESLLHPAGGPVTEDNERERIVAALQQIGRASCRERV